MNDYETLGVPQTADEQEIRAAYIMLARRYHPDNGERGDEEALKRINTAYENIRREKERAASLPEVEISGKKHRHVSVIPVLLLCAGVYIFLRILLELLF